MLLEAAWRPVRMHSCDSHALLMSGIVPQKICQETVHQVIYRRVTVRGCRQYFVFRLDEW